MSHRKVNPESLKQGHEPLQASARGLAIFAACFAVGLAALFAATWGVYVWTLPPVPDPAVVVRPPAPNLQPSPRDPNLDWQDLKALNDTYRDEFAARGWLAKDGSVKVPDSVVQRVIAESKQPRGGNE